MTAPRRSVVAEADFDMQKRQKSRYVVSSLACGAVAGAVAKTTTAPLDRLKILIQVSSKPFELAHAPSRVREIIHHEGFKKLWRGNSATLARIMPYAGLQFTAYEQYKLLLQQVTDRKYDALHAAAALAFARVLGDLARETTEARCRPVRCRLRQHAQLTSLADAPLAARSNLKAGHTAIAGAGAGATATLCTYPLDYIRSRMAVQTHKSGEPFESLPHALRVSVAEHGWRSLFRGIWPTLIGIVPYAGTSFAVYETLKLSARGMRGTSRTDKELHPLERMGSGALAGLVGQSVAYPLDVIRRRMQTDGMRQPRNNLGMMAVARLVLEKEGVRGMFKGLTLNWIKGPVAVAISFTVFDFLKVRVLDPIK